MIVAVEPISMIREGRGYTEDGFRVYLTDWMVRLELDNGARFVHHHVFLGKEIISEEGFAFEGEATYKENEARATAFAKRIWDGVQAGKVLNPDYWTEIDPCYGSKAYIAKDRAGWFYHRERAEG